MTPDELDRVLELLDEHDSLSVNSVGGETWVEGAEELPERVAEGLLDPDQFIEALRRRSAARRLLSETNEEGDDG